MKTAREIIENYDGPHVRIMEVCGTHTHEIFRLGIRKLLPEQVELISGPGCPVCVTPVSFIDEAIYLALEKGVTICTFGDLVRVPGTKMSLAGATGTGSEDPCRVFSGRCRKICRRTSGGAGDISVGRIRDNDAGRMSFRERRQEKMDWLITPYWRQTKPCPRLMRH